MKGSELRAFHISKLLSSEV